MPAVLPVTQYAYPNIWPVKQGKMAKYKATDTVMFSGRGKKLTPEQVDKLLGEWLEEPELREDANKIKDLILSGAAEEDIERTLAAIKEKFVKRANQSSGEEAASSAKAKSVGTSAPFGGFFDRYNNWWVGMTFGVVILAVIMNLPGGGGEGVKPAKPKTEQQPVGYDNVYHVPMGAGAFTIAKELGVEYSARKFTQLFGKTNKGEPDVKAGDKLKVVKGGDGIALTLIRDDKAVSTVEGFEAKN